MKKHKGMQRSSAAVQLSNKSGLESLINNSTSCSSDVIALTKKILICCSSAEQLNVVKKLSDTAVQVTTADHDRNLLLTVLVMLYYNTPSKCALQLAIGSSLDGLADLRRNSQLSTIMLQPLCSSSTKLHDLSGMLRSLLDSPHTSFRYGIVQSHSLELTNGLIYRFRQEVTLLFQQSICSGQDFTAIVDTCHSCLQLLYKLLCMLQNKGHNPDDLDKHWSCLYTALQGLLLKNIGTMDLQLCAGMCLVQMLHIDSLHLKGYREGGVGSSSSSAQSVMGGNTGCDCFSSWCSQILGDTQLDAHLTTLPAGLLPPDALSPQTACCILSGIVCCQAQLRSGAVTSTSCNTEAFSCTADESCTAGTLPCDSEMSCAAIQATHRTSELVMSVVRRLYLTKLDTATELVFSKMLSTWTSTLRSPELRRFVQDIVYRPTFEYVLRTSEHTSEAVRQSSRSVFANLLTACKTNDEIRSDILSALTSYSWKRKGKYGLLREYINVFGADGIIHTEKSNVPDGQIQGEGLRCGSGPKGSLVEILDAMQDQKLANHISDFLCVIMKADPSARDKDSWMLKWLHPIVTALHLLPASASNINQYLLAKIGKLWPDCMVNILESLSSPVESHSPTADDLGTYLIIARQARVTGLLRESESNELTWCGLIPCTLIQQSLNHPSSEVRLLAFALLCDCHKTATVIPSYEFDWVLEFVRHNSCHEEPSFRNRMLSHLKHFLYHSLESSRKISPEQGAYYKEFFTKLMGLQVARVSLEATSTHRSVALEILHLLTASFPYRTLPLPIPQSI